jgi:hypothetical protein
MGGHCAPLRCRSGRGLGRRERAFINSEIPREGVFPIEQAVRTIGRGPLGSDRVIGMAISEPLGVRLPASQ